MVENANNRVDGNLNPAVFRDAIENLDAAIAIYDREDRLVFYNAKFKDMYPAFGDILDRRPKFEELANISRQKNVVHGMLEGADWADIRIDRHRKADGRPFLQRLASGRWLKITEARLGDSATATIQTDVTDLVDEQRRRKEQSQLLQNTIESIGEGLCVIDTDGVLVVRNKAACRLLMLPETKLTPGISIDRILTDHAKDQRHSRLLFQFFCPDFPDGRATDFELDQGTTLELRSYQFGSDGLVSIIKDISERSRVQEMNRVLAAFPRENPNPVMSANADGEISYVNHAVENLLLELEIDSGLDLLPAEHHEIVAACIRTGEVADDRRSEPAGRILEWTYRPQRRGNMVHIYGKDITDRLRAERDRKEMESALHHAQRLEALGSLAGGIAHEFNNMLMPMLGLSEMTLKRLPPDSVERKNMERIFAAGKRAKGLVSEILSFGRVQDMSAERFSLDEALDETVKLIESTMPASIEFAFRSEVCGLYLQGDASRIQQVLMNLCANAVHAIDGRVGRIELLVDEIDADDTLYSQYPTLKRDADRIVKISVVDTGDGIDKADLDRIFEPFFTTKGVGQGTGLGLSVVHGIVQKLGGDISVYSRKGAGTRFDVLLPADESAAVETGKQPEPEARLKTGVGQ